MTDSESQLFSAHLEDSISAMQSLAEIREAISSLVDRCEHTVKEGGVIYSFGNGGSACEAMHLAEELVARYNRERPGIRAMHLNDPSTITCWGNDYSFDTIFARQIDTFATEKDTVIAFSTSGNSTNILKALESCKKSGAYSVLLGGNDGGKAKPLVDLPLIVNSHGISARIQEAHMFIVHVLVHMLEDRLFPES